MTAGTAPALATYDDLLRPPEDMHAEAPGGETVSAPAPLPRHANVGIAFGRHDIARQDSSSDIARTTARIAW